MRGVLPHPHKERVGRRQQSGERHDIVAEHQPGQHRALGCDAETGERADGELRGQNENEREYYMERKYTKGDTKNVSHSQISWTLDRFV